MNALIVIPARYNSERFPGKPLEMIDGVSLIERVYEKCLQTHAEDVIVATDDQRIFDHVQGFDGNVCMTSASHKNGTERIIEAVERLMDAGEEYECVINVQGDEPLINPKDINRLIAVFEEDDTDIATLVKRIDDVSSLSNPNVVKAVLTEFEDGVADALYFSRTSIPYVRDNEDLDLSETPFYKHLGTYGFSVEVLLSLATVQESALEKAEKLEQLRWLQNHYVVSAIETKNDSIGVDTPEDIKTVENILKSK
ncbi:MAG: 3-deoxy-manno-octulosonate cytidylyltransferase [Bacteroidetes bacterium]|jgi:3-deoxy-manno-octulosonate cytidylyltransferase (CMP-KDO synthetase)|nr:3-deoxy-manno-octulosonate cytidylyltransferase [Bacteroidota bacterium]